MPERQEHFTALAFHGRGRASLLPLPEIRVSRRQRQQATLEHQGGQRDLLSRPSAPGMARWSLQGRIHGVSGERAVCPTFAQGYR